jgi:hypothetical protein
MRRYFTAPWLAAVLAVAAGLIGFAWQVHDLGQSCGYAEGGPQPNFPTKIALIVLIAVPVVVTASRALGERRSVGAVVRLAVLAAILAGVGFAAAQLAFFLSRHCYA